MVEFQRNDQCLDVQGKIKQFHNFWNCSIIAALKLIPAICRELYCFTQCYSVTCDEIGEVGGRLLVRTGVLHLGLRGADKTCRSFSPSLPLTIHCEGSLVKAVLMCNQYTIHRLINCQSIIIIIWSIIFYTHLQVNKSLNLISLNFISRAKLSAFNFFAIAPKWLELKTSFLVSYYIPSHTVVPTQ